MNTTSNDRENLKALRISVATLALAFLRENPNAARVRSRLSDLGLNQHSEQAAILGAATSRERGWNKLVLAMYESVVDGVPPAFDLQAHVKSGPYISRGYRKPALPIKCADGFVVSVQASERHYCSPQDLDGPYTEFELGFPSEEDDLILEYAEDSGRPTGTVYAWVPLAVVEALLEKHGGVVGFGELE